METTVKCPKCGTKIGQKVLNNFIKSVKADFENQLAKKQVELDEIKSIYHQLKSQKQDFNSLVESGVQIRLKEESAVIREKIRQEVAKEASLQLDIMEKTLEMQANKLREMAAKDSEIKALQQQFELKEIELVQEQEKILLTRLEEAKKEMQDKLQNSQLKLEDKNRLISKLTEELEAIKVKLDSSNVNVKLSGTVQEECIENIINDTFPQDSVLKIKPGQAGADLIYVLQTDDKIEIGPRILIESKRVKVFNQKSFVKKIKSDNNKMEKPAQALVIVTSVMPRGFEEERFIISDGVFITRIQDVRDLIIILRYNLLRIAQYVNNSKNKPEKQELLYDYITSQEFVDLFQQVITQFDEMRESFEQEKKKVIALYNQRQKALDSVLNSTIQFYSTARNLSGEISNIKPLNYRQAG